MKIIIFAPANVESGGPELLQQLCFELIKAGHNAMMCYTNYNANEFKTPIPDGYKAYNNPYVDKFCDSSEVCVVIPETYYFMLDEIIKAKKYFWWMSVDNFYGAYLNHYFSQKKFNISDMPVLLRDFNESFNRDPGVIHLVQSQYAKEHCKKIGITSNQIMELSDYLNPLFIKNALENNFIKKDIVLYNPKKGYEFTKKLITAAPEIRWIPLTGFTVSQMAKILSAAKVYIDFGEHPGKDRIPREAVISGCCILTGKKGAAAFYEDVPINKQFKFEDSINNIDKIIYTIKYIFRNYSKVSNKFIEYRSLIMREQDGFRNNVKKIFAE